MCLLFSGILPFITDINHVSVSEVGKKIFSWPVVNLTFFFFLSGDCYVHVVRPILAPLGLGLPVAPGLSLCILADRPDVSCLS